MQNTTIQHQDGKLMIIIDMNAKTTPSKSGKSNIIATTSGNVNLDEYGLPDCFLGLNLYKK